MNNVPSAVFVKCVQLFERDGAARGIAQIIVALAKVSVHCFGAFKHVKDENCRM